MEDDLSILPIWWANDGDAVIVSDIAEAHEFVNTYCDYLSSIGICTKSGIIPHVEFTEWKEGYDGLCRRTGRDFVPTPWGWSRAVVERFRRFGIPDSSLPSDSTVSLWRDFSSRALAVDYIRGFIDDARELGLDYNFVGRKMRFCKSVNDVYDADWFSVNQLIFKPLWSSSGRGIFVSELNFEKKTEERLASLIRTHGGFVADCLYDKLIDFAMEFEVYADGTAGYTGLSVFDAATDGRYGGNVVEPEESLQSRVIEHIGIRLYNHLRNTHSRMLADVLGGRYVGPVGVDMIVAKKEGRTVVHPCIEINLRMNMGILSHHLFRRFNAFSNALERVDGTNGSVVNLNSPISIPLTPVRISGFNARLTDGRFMLSSS